MDDPPSFVAFVNESVPSTTCSHRLEGVPLNYEFVGVLFVTRIVLAVVWWCSLLLSFDRSVSPYRTSTAEKSGLAIFLVEVTVRVVGAMAQRTGHAFVQFAMATIGSSLGWLALVLIFNNTATLPPTRKQWAALPASLLVQALWETQGYIVVNHL